MKVILKGWDSNFFNLKVGEYKVENNVGQNVKAADFDLIYCYSESEINLSLSNFLNSYSEIQLNFRKKIIPINYKHPEIFELNQLSEFNINELYELAYESGKYSRFKLDSKFSEKQFQELYEKWIDNSINSQFADIFLIFFKDEKITGFVTCNVGKDSASIGLLAVNENQQGKGIGRILIHSLESYLHKNSIDILNVVTQSENNVAIDSYKKMGFELITQKYIKHYWKL
ncbi:Acetyltransferase (GNAT) domain-containing protein [Gillisia sp. Hel1_33_143]|uniref:GNAT family N-acetyltransferase n=1 Tax=Gillisia sp. Hel1_33_143 TaxID=1336796 RepID=UPI000879D2C5|nr:GNAT family N-acetyltransferase [Gillisia sp. Hel1_33_143]SDS24163.1 Acetyltransferase (GNAT) domain-containing protein [Gillisia sp. Hel1_33_143]